MQEEKQLIKLPRMAPSMLLQCRCLIFCPPHFAYYIVLLNLHLPLEAKAMLSPTLLPIAPLSLELTARRLASPCYARPVSPTKLKLKLEPQSIDVCLRNGQSVL